MFTSTIRVIKFALQNFRRNIWLSIATVSMLVLTLLSVNVLVALNVLGKTAVRSVEERIDVTASFVPDVSEQVVTEVSSYFSALEQVKSVELISSEKALEEFKAKHENNPQILRSLEELEKNPFGPTLVIRANSTSDYPFILEALENPTYREFIVSKNFADHELIISRINNLTARLRAFGISLAAFFAIIAILIIMNTIRVAIYTYREEIGIMKLVGASNWFVRAPFLFESLIYSLLAVAITAIIVLPVSAIVEPQLQNFFEGVPVGLLGFFRDNFFIVFGVELLALVVLNMISSATALGKYLKN